ncbi:MAG: hypothetical protein MK008_12550 [Bdellovibrionales bacterium]|nr:hypothetical protein [Bdellovibrionales bacterium]
MKHLTCVIVLIFSTALFAQDKTYEQLKAEEINLKNEIAQVKESVQLLETEIEDSKKEIKAESHFDDASVAAMRRLNLNRLNSRKKANQEKVEQLQAKLEGLNIHIERKRTAVLADKAAAGVQKLTELVQINGIDINVSQLMSETNNIDLMLDEIEREMEMNAVGLYVQDKIGQLLNSQVICAARKRCLTKGKDEIKASTIQKELFPDSLKTRSEYYDKVKSRSNQGTN